MSEHDHQPTTATAQGPQPEGPPLQRKLSLQALDALLAEGKPNPAAVAALVKAHPGDSELIYRKLNATLGMGYTQRVAAIAGGAKPPRADGLPENDPGVENQLVTNDHKVVGSFSAKDQNASIGRKTTDVAINGEDSYQRDTTNMVGGGKAANGGYGVTGSHATVVKTDDHGVGVDKSSNVSGGINTKGFNLAASHDTAVKAGEHGKGKGHDIAGGYGPDGVDVDLGASHSTVADGVEKTNKGSLGWGDGGPKGGFQHTSKPAEGAPGASTTAGGTLGINKEAVSATGNFGHTNANGTTQSANAGASIGPDGVSAHAGYSLMTKGGSGVNASVSHGTKVTATPPVWSDGKWQVSYVRATTNGASGGGSLGGGGFSVGIGGGAESKNFESGTKLFENYFEALEFYGHPAEGLGEPLVDPATVGGAMLLPIGETIGGGNTTTLSANGSVSLEGAKLGAAAHESKTNEMDMKRVDAQHIDVTVTIAGEREHEISIAGGLSDTVSTTKNSAVAITWRFDLFTTQGQAAYEKFCKDHVAPADGTAHRMLVERIARAEDKDAIALGGLTNDYTATTDENIRTDDKGEHEAFHGTQANDINAGWFSSTFLGDRDAHSSASLESRMENGQDAGYTATMKYSGENGDHNRAAMNELFMMGDAKGHAAKASGDWTLSADIPKETMDELAKYPKFAEATNDEDRRRAFSAFIAERGAAGFGGLGYVGGKSLEWDVELKGDKNFPGKEGRIEFEQKVAKLDKDLDAGADPKTVYAEVETMIKEQAGRYAAIDDRSQYTDLPGELRQKVLDQIQHNLVLLKNYRGNIGAEAMAAHHDGGDPKLAAMQKEMDTLNANIKRDNHRLQRLDQAVNRAMSHLIDAPSSGAAAAMYAGKGMADNFENSALASNQEQDNLEVPIQQARASYLAATDKMAAASHLLDLTRRQADDVAKAVLDLQQAAAELKPITTKTGVAGYEDVWSTVPGEVGSAVNAGDDDDNS